MLSGAQSARDRTGEFLAIVDRLRKSQVRTLFRQWRYSFNLLYGYDQYVACIRGRHWFLNAACSARCLRVPLVLALWWRASMRTASSIRHS
jgi:Syntaxin-5 N-terminal, Sly1p-binding domain